MLSFLSKKKNGRFSKNERVTVTDDNNQAHNGMIGTVVKQKMTTVVVKLDCNPFKLLYLSPKKLRRIASTTPTSSDNDDNDNNGNHDNDNTVTSAESAESVVRTAREYNDDRHPRFGGGLRALLSSSSLLRSPSFTPSPPSSLPLPSSSSSESLSTTTAMSALSRNLLLALLEDSTTRSRGINAAVPSSSSHPEHVTTMSQTSTDTVIPLSLSTLEDDIINDDTLSPTVETRIPLPETPQNLLMSLLIDSVMTTRSSTGSTVNQPHNLQPPTSSSTLVEPSLFELSPSAETELNDRLNGERLTQMTQMLQILTNLRRLNQLVIGEEVHNNNGLSPEQIDMFPQRTIDKSDDCLLFVEREEAAVAEANKEVNDEEAAVAEANKEVNDNATTKNAVNAEKESAEMASTIIEGTKKEQVNVAEYYTHNDRKDAHKEASTKHHNGKNIDELVVTNGTEKIIGRQKYVQELESSPTCSICLGKYQLQDTIRTIPCFHTFHKDCIDQWLSRKAKCPLCNLSVNTVFSMP